MNRALTPGVPFRPAIFFMTILMAWACGPPARQATPPPQPPQAPEVRPGEPTPPEVEISPLADAVEIRRTTYGVPHVLAETLEAAAFGLAWVMMEDYREEVPRQLLEANGRWAAVEGPSALEDDFPGQMAHDYAVEVYPGLPADVRGVLRGFAAGVNDFIRLHGSVLPPWVRPEFTPQDVAAKDFRVWDQGAVRELRRQRESSRGPSTLQPEPPTPGPRTPHGGSPHPGRPWEDLNADVGSNAWAFAPGRTTTGNTILVRNPHLSFTSGYYEAHLTVPGVLNFYGDYRLGGPFGIIGGFNNRLGWSTTNNYVDPDQVYAVRVDPGNPEAYLFDGASVPIRTRRVRVEYLDGDTLAEETRTFRFTPLGPVLMEASDTIFVLKSAALRQHRIGEQWLRMMRARNLEEWEEAMRIRAKYSSNFTYADADGNIFYVWNASVPVLPHPSSDDGPVFASGRDEVWTELHPWDELPQLLNPRGGYVQNANDPPYYTNLNEVLDRASFPAHFPEPRLRLRSQHSLALVHNDEVVSLEDVVHLKHSMTVFMAQRVKDDLVQAVRATGPEGEVLKAIQLLADWDNRAARDSRGGTLFELWASRYLSRTDPEAVYREPWSADDPTGTPRGLGDRQAAVEAFHEAMEEAEERFGGWDVTWGEVHRIRAGNLDLPVGGCASGLGCFRVIGFAEDDDGKYRARRGDAWILAVEFAEVPRAYSVLLYGNSNREDSPWFYNQAEMFADNRMKAVAFTEDDIQHRLVERYRPGRNRRF